VAEPEPAPGNSLTKSVAAGAAPGNASVDGILVASVAAAGAEIDRLFRAAMGACARSGGGALRSRHGPGYGELLIDFRTVLAAPDGVVTPAAFAEVMRYHDSVDVESSIRRAEDRGALIRDDGGQIRATAAGHAFFDDLYAAQADALGSLWAGADESLARLTAITGELIVAASLDPLLPVGAFTAMTELRASRNAGHRPPAESIECLAISPVGCARDRVAIGRTERDRDGGDPGIGRLAT